MSGHDITLQGVSQNWIGHGKVDGNTGYYDWRFPDGRTGHNTFMIRPDGSLQVTTHSSAFADQSFIARPAAVANQQSPATSTQSALARPPQRRTLSNAEVAKFLNQCTYIGHTGSIQPEGSVSAQQCAAFAKVYEDCGTLFGMEKVMSVFMTRSSGVPFNRKGLNSCIRENYVGP
jgi:hypothetical protein